MAAFGLSQGCLLLALISYGRVMGFFEYSVPLKSKIPAYALDSSKLSATTY